MLEHGGRLLRAARRYGIAAERWLDLSTGISPWSWYTERAPSIPAECWSQLPQDEDDELAQLAQRYYGGEGLPVAGSQAAIQALPRLRGPCRVGVLTPGYAEHAWQWQRAGHAVQPLAAAQLLDAVDRFDVLQLSSPNNPDGLRLPREALLAAHERLAARGGWLLVDEAYADAEPRDSLASEAWRPGLIVLRSLGKFFGLAGARVGFVLAEPGLRAALQAALGPWPIAGPSRYLAIRALRDRSWQAQQRLRLLQASAALAATLRELQLPPQGGCALFHWLAHGQAPALHGELAKRGILTRLFEAPISLRLGLPTDEAALRRLRDALRQATAA